LTCCVYECCKYLNTEFNLKIKYVNFISSIEKSFWYRIRGKHRNRKFG
jgi:hypothetical protein